MGIDIKDYIWGSDLYPTMFNSGKNMELYKLVNLEELDSVLKYFKKDKFPGLDG